MVLNGTESRDPDGYVLTYSWEQLGVLESPGTPQVTIVGSSEATASFTAPDYSGALSFQLTVTDTEGELDTATVNVIVHSAPVADAGPNQVVPINALATLCGAAADEDPGHVAAMTYAWTQTSGATVTLSDPTEARPTFTPTP